MGKIALKREQILKALDRLLETIQDLDRVKKEQFLENEFDNERLYRVFRDSAIQRFEFCVDLFWKYLKRYLEEVGKQPIDIHAPKPVVRHACKAKLLSEEDAEIVLVMINDRNMSSHLYKEEVADQIACRIGDYFDLMRKYVEKLV